MQNTADTKISQSQQDLACNETQRYIRQAETLFNRTFEPVPVLFDLRGRAAGMYRVQAGQRVIRYNPYIFARYFDSNLKETIPHEVAHYISDMVYGLRRIRPHGREWKEIMLSLGAEPKRTADYDLTGLPTRQFRQFTYSCNCQKHQLTTRRHNNIQNGLRLYACRLCGGKLKWLSSSTTQF